jgi:hypothetical protein
MEAAGGFLVGSEPGRLLVALGLGVLGSLLAILFYKAAVAVAGFVIGSYLAADLVRHVSVPPHSLGWLPYLVGGLLGAVLILLVLDWALIALSSLAGASLMVHSMHLTRATGSIVFVVLAAIGILIQSGIWLRSQKAPT